MLKNKKGIIFGVANDHSIAWGIAKKLSENGAEVAITYQNDTFLKRVKPLAEKINSKLIIECDFSKENSIIKCFEKVQEEFKSIDFVIHAAAFSDKNELNGKYLNTSKDNFINTLNISCYSFTEIAQEASKIMLKSGHGTIMFTGASAGVKGFAKSATFAMGKFGLRGLAQSMARELHPQNIHVVHVVVDGGIKSMDKNSSSGQPADNWLLPDAIADTYYHLYMQHRSAWTWEIEVRPWVENF